MTGEYLTDEKQTDTVAIRFGGEEGSEEVMLRFLGYSHTVVGYGQCGGLCDGYRYPAVGIAFLHNALYAVLYYVYQHLRHKRDVDVCRNGCVAWNEIQVYVMGVTQGLQELKVRGYERVQWSGTKFGLRYLHHISKAGDERRHVVAAGGACLQCRA